MIFTPQDIDATMLQIDAQGATIDIEIASCKALDPPSLAAQWLTFYATYKAWSVRSHEQLRSKISPIINPISYTLAVNRIGSEAENYQTQMNQWAVIADKQCGGHAGLTTISGGAEGVTTTLEVVAVIAALGVAGYALFTFSPFIRSLGAGYARGHR